MKQILIMFIALTGVSSLADVVVEESGANAYFLVDGHKSTPVEATVAAEKNGVPIERCTAIKDARTTDGQPAYRCKRVIKRINPKNGNSTWKNL